MYISTTTLLIIALITYLVIKHKFQKRDDKIKQYEELLDKYKNTLS